MDSRTRHQLKQDEFRDSLVKIEDYFTEHYKEIITVSIIVVLVVGLAGGLKYYTDHQRTAANTDLGEALDTFRAYVGQPSPEGGPGGPSFATAQEKYKKALQQFDAIVDKYKMIPRPKAVEIALYQAGVCQSLLGDNGSAIRTLTQASQDHDTEVASLAKFALAGELAKAGNLPEAEKLYDELADHPTLTVPKATALLALADAYRQSQPAKAREVYERVEKEFASNAPVAEAVKQDIATLAP